MSMTTELYAVVFQTVDDQHLVEYASRHKAEAEKHLRELQDKDRWGFHDRYRLEHLWCVPYAGQTGAPGPERWIPPSID